MGNSSERLSYKCERGVVGEGGRTVIDNFLGSEAPGQELKQRSGFCAQNSCVHSTHAFLSVFRRLMAAC